MPSVSTTQARINELSAIIHQYNHSYYCCVDSESSLLGCNDETYDLLVRELEELEKQEREKSIIKDHEKDLKELERLEKEITEAETDLRTSSLDEDKFLEQTDLDEVEKKARLKAQAFDSMDQIEEEIGKKYMEDDLKAKENRYGLSEYDIEEVDRLMNQEMKGRDE
mgnify:CR=1 FL=1